MTLIAIHAQRDRADILTDTWRYTQNAQSIQNTSKVLPLPHLNVAIAGQGDAHFTDLWKSFVLTFGDGYECIDDLNAAAPEHLRAVDASFTGEDRRGVETSPSAVFHVGYSRERGEFTATGFAADWNNFEPFPLDDFFVLPTPLFWLASDFEMHRWAECLREGGIDPDTSVRMATLRDMPPPRTPSTDQDWVNVGRAVRVNRAMGNISDDMKVFIGGSLIHTVLRDGEVSQRTVHRFDDTGEEFFQVVQGSLHPRSQRGPCYCGSGQRYFDCHLQPALDQPCSCRSGQSLRDCCAIRDRPAVALATNS